MCRLIDFHMLILYPAAGMNLFTNPSSLHICGFIRTFMSSVTRDSFLSFPILPPHLHLIFLTRSSNTVLNNKWQGWTSLSSLILEEKHLFFTIRDDRLWTFLRWPLLGLFFFLVWVCLSCDEWVLDFFKCFFFVCTPLS